MSQEEDESRFRSLLSKVERGLEATQSVVSGSAQLNLSVARELEASKVRMDAVERAIDDIEHLLRNGSGLLARMAELSVKFEIFRSTSEQRDKRAWEARWALVTAALALLAVIADFLRVVKG